MKYEVQKRGPRRGRGGGEEGGGGGTEVESVFLSLSLSLSFSPSVTGKSVAMMANPLRDSFFLI